MLLTISPFHLPSRDFPHVFAVLQMELGIWHHFTRSQGDTRADVSKVRVFAAINSSPYHQNSPSVSCCYANPQIDPTLLPTSCWSYTARVMDRRPRRPRHPRRTDES